MKKKKNKLIKLLKTGILFFGISLLLWNCEKDDFLPLEDKKNEKIEIIDRNYFELNNEIKFNKAIRIINDSKTKKNIKFQSKKGIDIYNFTIDSSKIRKIEKDSITSYTFFVKRDKVDSKFFENLVVEFNKNEEPKAFIIKYKPIKKIKFFKEHNSFNFQGNIEVNRIDYDRLNLSAKMVCYSTEVVYCTLTGYDNYSGYYHYGTHVATPDCLEYGESNRFSLTQSNCITIDVSDWDNDGYSGGGSTGGGGSGSGPTDPDEEIDIITSALNYPCGDPIHGCTRTANKIASKLNLTENERLWLIEQDENFILDLETFLLENNSIEAENFVIEVINAKVSSNYENLFKLNIFIQDPYNVWKRLSEEEKSLIKSFPTEAYQIFKNRPIAEQETRKRYGRNGLNDKSDAFRHCFFNAKNAFKVGRFMAEKFSDAHESETPTRWVKEKEMDIHNNKIGLNFVFSHNRSISNSDLSSEVQKKINDGSLRYLKPINLNDPNFRFTHGITNSTTLTPTNK